MGNTHEKKIQQDFRFLALASPDLPGSGDKIRGISVKDRYEPDEAQVFYRPAITLSASSILPSAALSPVNDATASPPCRLTKYSARAMRLLTGRSTNAPGCSGSPVSGTRGQRTCRKSCFRYTQAEHAGSPVSGIRRQRTCRKSCFRYTQAENMPEVHDLRR